MVDPIEQTAHGVASAFDSHFQRRDAHSSFLCDLFVSQFFNVLQQKCLSLLGWQGTKGTLYMPPNIDLDYFLRTRCNRALDCRRS